MQTGIVLNMDDARHIIALYFGVDDKAVLKQPYSFTVIGAEMPKQDQEEPGK